MVVKIKNVNFYKKNYFFNKFCLWLLSYYMGKKVKFVFDVLCSLIIGWV